jgi:3-methyladenine DNA glycosylase/8-oxoguanine DNA glycosylase
MRLQPKADAAVTSGRYLGAMDDVFEVTGPLDLRRTLRPLDLLPGPTRIDGSGEAWRAMYTSAGPATVRLRTAPGGGTTRVEATAWGPGAAAALAAAPALVGGHDDPSVLVPQHPVVSDLQRRFRGLRLGRTGAVFDALVPAVLGQKVAGAEAVRSWVRLVRAHGTPAPGPVDLLLPPGADVLATLPYHAYHGFGIERRRAAVIIEAARHVRRLGALADGGPAGAARVLQALPGVGPWTAALVVGAALGDPDAVPVGDYNLPNTVAWALAGEPRADDDRMLALLEPYRGQRRRVLVLLKAAGIQAPRFGPRHALRTIERM